MGPGNPGKFLKPWKPLEKPWNFFLLIKPWKISQQKKICEMVHFVDFITSNNRYCRFLYHFKTSFCVRYLFVSIETIHLEHIVALQ